MAAVGAAAVGAGAVTAAAGAGAGAVLGLPLIRFQMNSSAAAPASQGSQRMSPDFVAVVAAAAPPATAAPARLAESAAWPPRPPRNAAGLAKPSAELMRLSSTPCRCAPWPDSSEDSALALSALSLMNFFRKVSASGTMRATRLFADAGLIPLEELSAEISAPALSPNRAGIRVAAPVSRSAFTPVPPPLNNPARFPSAPASRLAPLISDIRPVAPWGVAPFRAMPPITAGSSEPSADWVAP